MLVCSRCQSQAQRLVHYCSRNCQVSHFKLHKPTCGVKLATRPEFPSIADPDAPFQPTQALLYHLAALSTLPPSASPNTPPPSFLYFPSNPLSDAASSSSKPPVMPIPISLPPPARNLFNCLSWVAFRTANPLSVVLMYSLLLTEIEALGGVEDRLVEQLSEEYRLDGVQELGGEKRRSLRRMLDDEDEPESEDLMVAIGGETNQGILVEWQMYEAERTRPTK
ncbi:hypothetical protein JCM10295v2_005272 [Rhodotorula toruloides]